MRVLQMLGCIVLLALWGLPAHGAQGQSVPGPSAHDEHLSVELLVPPQQLAPGGSFTAGLHFTMAPGWHIYWVNAGDSGEPPTVKWTLPSGVTAKPFEYPAPQRLPLGPLMDFGYENEVTFPVPMQVAADAPPGPATLRADLEWLVCKDVCLPGKATLAVARPVAAAGAAAPVDAAAQKIVDAGLASLPKPLPSGDKAVFSAGGKSYTLAVLSGAPLASAKFFPLDQTVISDPAPQPAEALAKGVRLTLTRDENQQGKLATLNGVVVLPNGTAYTIAAQPGTIPPEMAAAAGSSDSLAGLGGAAALGFLGGIILNLMPCVFPVLFIKGLSLLRSSQAERHTLRAHGWMYTLGILVSFWAVGVTLLVLRAGGAELGWGFQFQSPVFLALIALLLLFVSLSLAGQFEIGLSLTGAGGSLAQRQGYAGSFFTGVLAMVVATPCTAPLMGVALGYAVAHGAVASMTVFTALGLGLATPFLLLAFNPGWTRLLPKPGAWMEVLKQVISIPIFATVIWLVWLFTQLAGANALMGLLAGFLLLGIAGALLGHFPARRAATAAALLLVALAVVIPVYATQVFRANETGTEAHSSTGDWQPYSRTALEEDLAAGKPVFVDFTASWCLSCQVNQRLVLDRADVQQRLRKSGVVLMKADWTRHDPAIGEALAALGRSGIPAYALYSASPDGAPHMLPEVLTRGAVFSALDGLHPAKSGSAGQ